MLIIPCLFLMVIFFFHERGDYLCLGFFLKVIPEKVFLFVHLILSDYIWRKNYNW